MYKDNSMSHIHFYTDFLYNNIIKDTSYRSVIDRVKNVRQKGYSKRLFYVQNYTGVISKHTPKYRI